jgi:hypothetical protein
MPFVDSALCCTDSTLALTVMRSLAIKQRLTLCTTGHWQIKLSGGSNFAATHAVESLPDF